MSLIEILLIAVGLSMDAFAVAISIGLAIKKTPFKNMLVVGVYFGGFQALMPAIGYLIAIFFADLIITFDHWVAFALLVFLGSKMIIESLNKAKKQEENQRSVSEVSLKPGQMLPLALATSIDAMAVGVSFAFLKVGIVRAAALIGIITLVISMAGVKIGTIFGAKFKSKAEIAGGIILILIGFNILFEHLNFFAT